MPKFRKAFVSNPNMRFDTEHLRGIAEDIVYVCDTPIYDHMLVGHKERFEQLVSKKMIDFDPDRDVIAFFGDPIIFAMMIVFASNIHARFTIARYSTSEEVYLTRAIGCDELEAA